MAGGDTMASEKEIFVTKQYIPVGQPISQNDHTVIYHVKCMAEPGHPDGILKMYRKKNIKSLYEQLQRLDYSGWPHIYCVRYFDESTLVVEERLNGHTLAELIDQNRARHQPFTEAEAVQIMEKVCEALEPLLSANPPIIHHDLKPSNIFVTATGRVKLLDFVPGQPHKKNPITTIFNIIGAIFHEMLTNKKPKNDRCTYTGKYEPVIRRCLDKNPTNQYTSITEIQEDIDYAKIHGTDDAESRKIQIPYTLTYPFQGFLLCFEWTLFAFFYLKNSLPTASLFCIALIINALFFFIRRHIFLGEKSAWLSPAQRFGPVLVLAALFTGIYFLLRLFIV